MKLIQVGGHYKGSKVLWAKVDDEAYPLLQKYRWVIANGYAARIEKQNGKRKMFLMHRDLLNAPTKTEVDHIDMEKLNNQRSNLRIVTKAQNMWNIGLVRTNTSGHKGVRWYKNRGKWISYIRVGGKQKHLGYFVSLEDALAAYENAARELRGDYARIV